MRLDDLLAFRRHITEPPSAILCMGDTVSHLPGLDAVHHLFHEAASALAPGGVLVLSLRDYSVPLVAEQRFIPVRGDASRILTCLLEYEEQAVLVHDILHERTSGGWQTRVSCYRKLRLAPETMTAALEASGFSVRREAGMRGMARVIARKAAHS